MKLLTSVKCHNPEAQPKGKHICCSDQMKLDKKSISNIHCSLIYTFRCEKNSTNDSCKLNRTYHAAAKRDLAGGNKATAPRSVFEYFL